MNSVSYLALIHMYTHILANICPLLLHLYAVPIHVSVTVGLHLVRAKHAEGPVRVDVVRFSGSELQGGCPCT